MPSSFNWTQIRWMNKRRRATYRQRLYLCSMSTSARQNFTACNIISIRHQSIQSTANSWIWRCISSTVFKAILQMESTHLSSVMVSWASCSNACLNLSLSRSARRIQVSITTTNSCQIYVHLNKKALAKSLWIWPSSLSYLSSTEDGLIKALLRPSLVRRAFSGTWLSKLSPFVKELWTNSTTSEKWKNINWPIKEIAPMHGWTRPKPLSTQSMATHWSKMEASSWE